MRRPRFLPDNFMLILLAMLALASVLPVRGVYADYASTVTNLAIALLFFLQEPEEYHRVQQTAMRTRYLWSDSVLSYEQMYKDALGLSAGH